MKWPFFCRSWVPNYDSFLVLPYVILEAYFRKSASSCFLPWWDRGLRQTWLCAPLVLTNSLQPFFAAPWQRLVIYYTSNRLLSYSNWATIWDYAGGWEYIVVENWWVMLLHCLNLFCDLFNLISPFWHAYMYVCMYWHTWTCNQVTIQLKTSMTSTNETCHSVYTYLITTVERVIKTFIYTCQKTQLCMLWK